MWLRTGTRRLQRVCRGDDGGSGRGRFHAVVSTAADAGTSTPTNRGLSDVANTLGSDKALRNLTMQVSRGVGMKRTRRHGDRCQIPCQIQESDEPGSRLRRARRERCRGSGPDGRAVDDGPLDIHVVGRAERHGPGRSTDRRGRPAARYPVPRLPARRHRPAGVPAGPGTGFGRRATRQSTGGRTERRGSGRRRGAALTGSR
jgi:hypothetical protein